MSAITITQLTKTYGTRKAVHALDLTIEEGKLCALLGLNGAGKTTTIKMLTGLTTHSSGDAMILGHPLSTEIDRIKPLINVSPQENAIAPNLSVLENVALIAEIYGETRINARVKAERLLTQFHLLDRRNDKAKKLSGGLMRRLSIAMALVTQPKILFLDEPTLGLDVRARRELWTIIQALKGSMTIVLTTHYLEEVEALADEIAILDQGELKAVGTLAMLQAQTQLTKLEDIFLALTPGGDHV